MTLPGYWNLPNLPERPPPLPKILFVCPPLIPEVGIKQHDTSTVLFLTRSPVIQNTV